VFALSRRQRSLSLVQLRMAFPDWEEEARRRVARACLVHQGMTLMETLALPRLRAEGARWLTLENEQALADAHKQGRGVILVTAHAGNWEMLPIALERLRIKGMAVASKLNNERLNRLVGDLRRFDWLDVAERGSQTSPRQLLGSLKRGEALIMVNDVDIEAQGVWVDFFGIPANTPRAPASLALKLGTPVLTYFDERLADGTHRIRFERVPVDDALRNAPDPVAALTLALSRRTESHVRAHPEQWVWNHRRWKRRPPPAARGA
jgi:KDO2-lipid IV(A) lauroyltransferase